MCNIVIVIVMISTLVVVGAALCYRTIMMMRLLYRSKHTCCFHCWLEIDLMIDDSRYKCCA